MLFKQAAGRRNRISFEKTIMSKIKIKELAVGILLAAASLTIVLLSTELILRFASNGLSLKNCVPRNYLIRDPISGYDISEKFPETKFRFIDSEQKVWSNELGCFDRPYMGEKDFILLAGDSFTWGYVPFEHNFGSLLEKETGKRVLKCGVEGYGTKQEKYKIEKVLKRIPNSPELIILGYCLGNDIVDDYTFPNFTVMNGYPVMSTVLSDIHTGEKNNRVNLSRIQHVKAWLAANSMVYRLLKQVGIFRALGKKAGIVFGDFYVYAFPPEKFPWLTNAWSAHLGNLKETKGFADSIGAKLLVVLIPNREQVYEFLRPNIKDADWGLANRKLKDFLEKEGINFLDLTASFVKYADHTPRKFLNSNDLYWKYDGHWNIKGYKLAGLLVGKYILDKQLVQAENNLQKLSEIEKQLKTF